jgi:serine protease inhibitor
MSSRGMNRRYFVQAGLAAVSTAAARSALAYPGILLLDDDTGQSAPRLAPDLVLPSQLRLGHHLVGHLAGGAGANVMVSPASLAAVLTMLSTGANLPLRHAIHHVLGFADPSRRAAARDISALNAAIGQTLRQANGQSPLAVANMIVFDPASKPRSRALAKLSVEGADVSVEDLRKTETIKRINEWVAQRTRNLIPSILDQPLGGHPGLVALNALYFKDKWRVPFAPGQTRTEKFHLVGGRFVDASIMYSPDGRYRFRQDERFIAAELSYASDDFRLVVVTTKLRPAHQHEFGRVTGWLSGAGFSEQDGLVALPRITMSSDVDLLRALDAMGLAPARLRHDAFHSFTTVPQTLSRVVQKAELKIDEEGTEAAAATAATTWRSAPMAPYTKMIVNKPFMFALRDRRTGLVLLNGYVATVRENM